MVQHPASKRIACVVALLLTSCALDLGGAETEPRGARDARGASDGEPDASDGGGQVGPSDGSDAATAMNARDAGFEPHRDAGVAKGCSGDPSDPECGYRFRRRITFDATDLTSELEDFPVLITLTPERIDYDAAREDGRDIRFVAADGKRLLAHEIDHWETKGTSYLWVKLPRVSARSRPYIYMVYGSPNAEASTSGPDVFSAEYAAVYHMEKLTAEGLRDSVGRHDGKVSSRTSANESASGKIGDAIAFDGVDDVVKLEGLDTSNWQAFTIEAWILSKNNADARILCQSSGTEIADHVLCLGIAGDQVRVRLSTSGAQGEIGSHDAKFSGSSELVHLAVTWDAGSEQVRVFENGSLTQSFAHDGVGVKPSSLQMVLGNVNLSDARFFSGLIDEVRISNVARSATWLSAGVASVSDALKTYGPRERL
jgi:biopolymer transport protein ExbB